MKFTIDFNEEKNLILQGTRGISFNEVIKAVEDNKILDNLKNRNYPNQKILVVRIKNYIYAVPYVIDRNKKTIFLKTVYPSRVLTKKYLGGKWLWKKPISN